MIGIFQDSLHSQSSIMSASPYLNAINAGFAW